MDPDPVGLPQLVEIFSRLPRLVEIFSRLPRLVDISPRLPRLVEQLLENHSTSARPPPDFHLKRRNSGGGLNYVTIFGHPSDISHPDFELKETNFSHTHREATCDFSALLN